MLEVVKDFQGFCAGVDLDLEPFQLDIADAAHGPEHELLVLLPRGNGKSALLAALAVHHLLTHPDPQVYVAAASREQASILYGYARRYCERLDAPGLLLRHLEIRVPGGHLRVLASDAPKLHGLTFSLAIVDELHAHRDGEVYLAMRTALHKRPGARLWTISTAGDTPDSPLGRLRARALTQPTVTRTGALTDASGPSLRMLEWAVPEDADALDPHEAAAANPASWIDEHALADQAEAVPEIAFRRYHCNQWVGREGSWLPPGAWQACVGDATIEPGEPIWVGVDIGAEQSATAVVWITEDGRVGCSIHHGEDGILHALDAIRELRDLYIVREVAFDPWRFGQAAAELAEQRVPVIAFPQSDSRMIPASASLHRAITEQTITLPDDPELHRHAGQVIARHNRRGWRIDKANRADNIDAVIALAMALERRDNQPAPAEVIGWI